MTGSRGDIDDDDTAGFDDVGSTSDTGSRGDIDDPDTADFDDVGPGPSSGRSRTRDRTETVRGGTTIDSVGIDRPRTRDRGQIASPTTADFDDLASGGSAAPTERERAVASEIDGVTARMVDDVTFDDGRVTDVELTETGQRFAAAEQTEFTPGELTVRDGDVRLTDQTRVDRARTQFETAREQARQTADIDRISALGQLDVDQLDFRATDEGVQADPRDGAADRTRVRGRQPQADEELEEEDFLDEAADELGVDPEDVELEETEGGFVARAEVEQDRPLADRFEDLTGVEVPAESEILSGPQRAAGAAIAGLGEANRRLSIPSQRVGVDDVPTSTGQARGTVEEQLGIDLPEGEQAVLDPLTERVDDATVGIDLGDIPESTEDLTDAFEERTEIDLPGEQEVVDPLQMGVREGASRAVAAQEQFGTPGAEFGAVRESDEARFDTGDIVDVAGDVAETAGDVNRRFSAPGAGFGTIDPEADPDRQTDLRGAAATGVVTPEPTTTIGGAAILGGLTVGAIAADTARRSELDVGSDTTEVREVEVGESDVSELDATEQARGTEEVGLGAGVGPTEVGLGEITPTTEVSIDGADEDVLGEPVDDTVVPGEFPLPGRDVARDPTRDAPESVDPTELLTADTASQIGIGGEESVVISGGDIIDDDFDPIREERRRAERAAAETDRTDLDDASDAMTRRESLQERLQSEDIEIRSIEEARQERQEFMDGLGSTADGQQRRSLTGAEEVVGAETGRVQAAQEASVGEVDVAPGAFESGTPTGPLDPLDAGVVGADMTDAAARDELGVGLDADEQMGVGIDSSPGFGLDADIAADRETDMPTGTATDSTTALDTALLTGTALVTETVPRTGTGTATQTAIEQDIGLDQTFEMQQESIESTPGFGSATTPPPTPDRRLLPGDGEGEGVRDDLGFEFDDALFETPTRSLDAADELVADDIGVADDLDDIGI